MQKRLQALQAAQKETYTEEPQSPQTTHFFSTKSFESEEDDTETPIEEIITGDRTTKHTTLTSSTNYNNNTEEKSTQRSPEHKKQKISPDSPAYSPTQTLNFTPTPNTSKKGENDTKHITEDTTDTTTATSTTSTYQIIQHDGGTNESTSGATTHPSSLD